MSTAGNNASPAGSHSNEVKESNSKQVRLPGTQGEHKPYAMSPGR